MRAAIRGLGQGLSPGRLRAWSSLPALYHRWAMTAGGERYLVAERAGRVLGYAALRGDELTAVFVRPSAARRGVGAALVRRVEGLAVQGGAAALAVDAARPAVPFYRALGFAAGQPRAIPLPGGLSLPAVRMRRRLVPARG
jgi:GNAT superfamily N-acetyltransferase